jgi:hypothetical protein
MAGQTFDPRFDPAFQRGYVPPVKPPVFPPAPLPVDSVGEAPAGADPRSSGIADAQVVAERRRVNPYVVILWVVGVVFVVGGTGLLFASYFQLLASYSAGPSQNTGAQTLYVFGSTFGVPMVTVGLATVAGLVFLSAWRRHDGASS